MSMMFFHWTASDVTMIELLSVTGTRTSTWNWVQQRKYSLLKYVTSEWFSDPFTLPNQ